VGSKSSRIKSVHLRQISDFVSDPKCFRLRVLRGRGGGEWVSQVRKRGLVRRLKGLKW